MAGVVDDERVTGGGIRAQPAQRPLDARVVGPVPGVDPDVGEAVPGEEFAHHPDIGVHPGQTVGLGTDQYRSPRHRPPPVCLMCLRG